MKKFWLYLLTIFLGVAYIIFIYWLKYTQHITAKEFVGAVTAVLGWGIALLLGIMHLQKTREDNQFIKREEIKKSFEVNAFREINRSVTNLSSAMSGLAVVYLTLPGKLKSYAEDKDHIFKFDKLEIESDLLKKGIDIKTKLYEFLLTIEGNEIAVIEFDHLRKYIQLEFDDMSAAIDEFFSYFIKEDMEILVQEISQLEFKEKCSKVNAQLWNIQSYLFDYRIELMNSLLGDVFDFRVPRRKPKDPKYKILTELAIKETVEKEAKEKL